jgi:hypothetical protein
MENDPNPAEAEATVRVDLEQFRRDGYVRVSAVADEPHLQAMRSEICAFHGIDLDRSETWSRMPADSWDIVPIHQSQASWDNRSLARVHAAFTAVLGTHRLWVSMDRSGFKAPAALWPERGPSPIHVDVEPPGPAELQVQGMLYLTDCDPGGGSFECVPSMLNAPITQREPKIGEHPIVSIPGRAGDLVIWNARLPHRGGMNTGNRPRLVQYLSMRPAKTDPAAAWERVELWRNKRVPSNWRGWPASVRDPEPGPPATLSPLGRRLLGLDKWD